MTCTHIRQVIGKMNELIGKIGNDNSDLYKNLAGTYLKREEVQYVWHRMVGSNKSPDPGISYEREYPIKAISETVLGEYLSEIGKLINDCNCSVSKDEYNRLFERHEKDVEDYNNLARNSVNKEAYEELKKQWKKDVDDYNKLAGDHKELAEKCKNLIERLGEYEDYKDKYDNMKDEREGERVNNARTNTKLEEKVESLSSQVIDFRKRLKDTESERDKLLIKLDEKNVIHNQKLEALNNQLTTLKLESGEKDSRLREKENELVRKNKEIERLKRKGGLSQEELLTEKLRSEKKNLELFAGQELKVDMEQIHSLTKYHERLFVAQKNHNQANIDIHEENISRVKKELQERTKISVINIQEICQKCERIGEFSWQLSQIQQQYEARQEVPPRNN